MDEIPIELPYMLQTPTTIPRAHPLKLQVLKPLLMKRNGAVTSVLTSMPGSTAPDGAFTYWPFMMWSCRWNRWMDARRGRRVCVRVCVRAGQTMQSRPHLVVGPDG